MAYNEENYNQSADAYASIAQAFQELKQDRAGAPSGRWGLPVHELSGVVLKLVGKNQIMLTMSVYQMATPEILPQKSAEMKKFLAEIVKDLKKRFKAKTKKSLKLKKISENDGIEKYSQVHMETSYASLANGPRRVMQTYGKYLFRCGCIYHFDTPLIDDEE